MFQLAQIVVFQAISRAALKAPKSYSALTEKSTGMFTDVADYKVRIRVLPWPELSELFFSPYNRKPMN